MSLSSSLSTASTYLTAQTMTLNANMPVVAVTVLFVVPDDDDVVQSPPPARISLVSLTLHHIELKVNFARDTWNNY
jgi:hypothetical protein